MARRCAVSPDTVVHAYRKLAAAGLVVPVRGSGFFVSGGLPVAAGVARRVADAVNPFSLRAGKPLPDLDLPPDRLPGSSLVHPALLPGEHVARLIRSTLRTRQDLLCATGDPEGYWPLRQQISRKLAREGIVCEPDAIVTGSGATGVMSLIVRSLVRPGMTALIEEPGPFIHCNLLLSQGAEVRGVPRTADGPDLEALRRLCEEHRPRILFCSSVHQNPTGRGMAPHAAHELLRLAEAFELIVVDDTTYADLRDPAGSGFWTPLAMLGGLRRVIHVGSFSRLLSPTLGIGYLAADAGTLELLSPYAAVHGRGPALLAERTVYQLLEDGRFERWRETVAAQVAARRRGLVVALQKAGLAVEDAGTGLFVWLDLGAGRDAAEVTDILREAGFMLAAPDLFGASSAHGSFTRLNATTTSDEVVRRLADAM